MKRFEKQVARTCPKNVNLNLWDYSQGSNFGPCDKILKQKWPVHKKGLVPVGTRPLVCADLKAPSYKICLPWWTGSTVRPDIGYIH